MIKDLSCFQHKIAVITGGSSGIGKSIAQQLASYQCNLILLSKDETSLQLTKRQLNSDAISIETYVCDVADAKEIKKINSKIKENHNHIDYLVNSAGISLQEEKGKFSEENFNLLMNVNLIGVYTTTLLLAYPLMSRGGGIVNISSIRARTGTPTFSSGYAAAKAGVINLTKSFALELADRNIRVNCVAPGATYPTGISHNWPKKLRLDIAAGIPLTRLGKPEDISHAACFLLSDQASYITGQTLDVNGGAWMN